MSPRKNDLKKTPYKTLVGKRLEKLRKQLDLSANAMAAGMNVSTWAYRAYMRGEYLPSTDSLVALAKAENISLDWLLMGKGHMFDHSPKKETEGTVDSFQREMDEMKHVMQRVPIIKYKVMGYYQQVKEQEKELIHRELEEPEAITIQPETRPAGIHQTPEAPPVALPKITKKPAVVIHTEPEIPAVINKEPETPPAVILNEPEAPTDAGPKEVENQGPVTIETGKPAPTKVKNLFPKKRKKKRK
ncbi:MAG: helix-turn-helix transcriptional regulator [bacterium]|nr:helix-turn-helix transcriptional regulator [bacterium]